MKRKILALITCVCVFGLSINTWALEKENSKYVSSYYQSALPNTFSYKVTLEEIENDIDEYITEHDIMAERGTEEYTKLMYDFCFSHFSDLTETTIRYYEAYASIYLSDSLDKKQYTIDETKTIGEIREENIKLLKDIKKETEKNHSSEIQPLFSSYDLFTAREYAKKYAIYPNLAFEYHPIAGDCTNFASQILYAGGMPMNTDWTNDSGNDIGHRTWINADGFTKYWSLMRNYLGPTCFSIEDIKNNADAGDFISWQNYDTYKFFHVQFVQNKTADREIYCTQHTPNYYNEKLSSRIDTGYFSNKYAVVIDFY